MSDPQPTPDRVEIGGFKFRFRTGKWERFFNDPNPTGVWATASHREQALLDEVVRLQPTPDPAFTLDGFEIEHDDLIGEWIVDGATATPFEAILLSEIVRLRGLVESLEATLAYWLVPADEIDDPAIPLTVRVYRTKEGRFLAVQRDALIEERDAARGLVETATQIERDRCTQWVQWLDEVPGAHIHDVYGPLEFGMDAWAGIRWKTPDEVKAEATVSGPQPEPEP